jgi:hypothetical protein
MKQLLTLATCASVCMSTAAMAQQTGSAETDLWNAIDPKHPCEYKAYLEDYPKGKYASLARLRLADCQTGSGPAATPDAAGKAGHKPDAVSNAGHEPDAASNAGHEPPAVETGAAVSDPHSSSGSTGAADSKVPDSEAARGDTAVAKLENMLRQRKIFNCGPDSQSFTVHAGILSYSACGSEGTRVKGSAPLSSLAVQDAHLKPLDNALMPREPALKDYVALWIPCARGSCYSIEVTSASGDRKFAGEVAAMAFYVPQSSSGEFLRLVKALGAPVDRVDAAQ